MAKNQNAVKLASTAAPAGNIIKKNVFALKTRPAMAEAGMQEAKLISAICEAGIEKGKKIHRIVKTVELKAKDPKGDPFVLTKKYNIMPNGRGFSAFTNDINAWSTKAIAALSAASMIPSGQFLRLCFRVWLLWAGIEP